MNPPFLIEADYNSIYLGWLAAHEGLEYEIQMLTIADGEEEVGKDSEEWVTLSSSLKGTEVLKKNVDHLNTYQFRMRVKYSSGWDLFSGPSGRLSAISPAILLSDPPVVVGRDAASVTLEWPKVDSASGYIIRYRLASNPGAWVVVPTVLLTNSCKKKGLAANEGYYFAVQPVEEGQEWGFSRSSQRCSPKEQKRHSAKCGYATEQGRLDWLAAHGVSRPEDKQAISQSYVADHDVRAPLYYWQLFSVLGLERIHAMVTCFYKRVYADHEEPWFREAFARLSDMEHHVATQTQFWADVMGGGRFYHGGDYRLKFHHSNNAAEVMTARGARRWMHHMRLAVQDNEASAATSFAAADPRALACLKDFLRTKMLKYANQHEWKFDNSDFDNFPE